MGDYTEQINKQIVIENFEFEGMLVLSVMCISDTTNDSQSSSARRR